MKFKLDENFGIRTQKLFRFHGHDVETVVDEGLQGCHDMRLFKMCCSEKRCLVTLDLDFANILKYPPSKSNGIVVIRPPQNTSLALLEQLVESFLSTLKTMPVAKKLWIVEIDRIRIHSED